jgi:hypothetical protein
VNHNTVTQEHLQRAFELARRPDWAQTTLADLLTAARHMALVQGLAQRLANGHGTTLAPQPTALADQPAPETVPLRCWDYPARRSGARPAGPTERRRTDAGPDIKRIAAGDRDD